MEPSQVALIVYRTILLHSEQDVSALAGHLSLDEEQVQEAVDWLMEHSLLAPSWEQQGRYRAVSPTLGLELLIQREQHELAVRQQRIEQHRAALTTLAAEYAAQGEAGLTGTERLVGADRIRTRLEMLAAQTRQEVGAFVPDKTLSKDGAEAAKPINERALARGVRFRTLYLDSILRERGTLDHVNWVIDRGGEIRTVPTLPMRLIIMDGRCAVVGDSTEEGESAALVLTNPALLLPLRALFDSYWEHATALGEPPQVHDCGLTPQERELIRLLATGAKDDTIARALGIGLRTERRMVAELADRLGASSRFELGVKASKLGWT
ncbi:hypothetical protein SRB5_26240 [Streptomyces sp. RB5]|uniref:HTH luxR-type domain-containing protein n=1 Tax=Streptomyces smaragdinus TaxID=2585196 RepID=A0A7K0CG84_9ACTN|nr:helix-turn-helix transcriptional regulator [Streptomyces smaragdinus]MQY12490.1 hypothetical protein [Streptomyces smaragdinus]